MAPSRDPGVDASGEDVAFQLYTSGTTGLPKGVMLTNDNFFNGVVERRRLWGFTPDSVNLAVMPMFHIAGSGWTMVGLLGLPAPRCCATSTRRAILQLIPEFGVTNVFIVPAVIQFLLLTPGRRRCRLLDLRAIVYGASPITDTTLTQAIDIFGCDFIQVYGLTETTGAITQLDAENHDPVHGRGLLRSCGKPYPWVEVRIVDPQTAPMSRKATLASCGCVDARTCWGTGRTRRRPRRRSTTTAGSRPAMPATATRTASSSCTTASRT